MSRPLYESQTDRDIEPMVYFAMDKFMSLGA